MHYRARQPYSGRPGLVSGLVSAGRRACHDWAGLTWRTGLKTPDLADRTWSTGPGCDFAAGWVRGRPWPRLIAGGLGRQAWSRLIAGRFCRLIASSPRRWALRVECLVADWLGNGLVLEAGLLADWRVADRFADDFLPGGTSMCADLMGLHRRVPKPRQKTGDAKRRAHYADSGARGKPFPRRGWKCRWKGVTYWAANACASVACCTAGAPRTQTPFFAGRRKMRSAATPLLASCGEVLGRRRFLGGRRGRFLGEYVNTWLGGGGVAESPERWRWGAAFGWGAPEAAQAAHSEVLLGPGLCRR